MELGPDGGAWSGFLQQAALPKPRCPEECRKAPLGERSSNRVSANAAGRRGHFPQGQFSSDFGLVTLEGNAPSVDAKRPEGRGWRPGAGAVGGVGDRNCDHIDLNYFGCWDTGTARRAPTICRSDGRRPSALSEAKGSGGLPSIRPAHAKHSHRAQPARPPDARSWAK